MRARHETRCELVTGAEFGTDLTFRNTGNATSQPWHIFISDLTPHHGSKSTPFFLERGRSNLNMSACTTTAPQVRTIPITENGGLFHGKTSPRSEWKGKLLVFKKFLSREDQLMEPTSRSLTATPVPSKRQAALTHRPESAKRGVVPMQRSCQERWQSQIQVPEQPVPTRVGGAI